MTKFGLSRAAALSLRGSGHGGERQGSACTDDLWPAATVWRSGRTCRSTNASSNDGSKFRPWFLKDN
jgi:hypothetical protein